MGTRDRAGREPAARSDGLAEVIARLRRALRRGARVADPGNRLAVAQLEALSAVTEQQGVRPGQLARQLHMRPNTVTTIVNALSAQGMLDRVSSAGDRRAIELTATEAGQQAVLTFQATNAAVLHLALSTLSAPQRRARRCGAGAGRARPGDRPAGGSAVRRPLASRATAPECGQSAYCGAARRPATLFFQRPVLAASGSGDPVRRRIPRPSATGRRQSCGHRDLLRRSWSGPGWWR